LGLTTLARSKGDKGDEPHAMDLAVHVEPSSPSLVH